MNETTTTDPGTNGTLATLSRRIAEFNLGQNMTGIVLLLLAIGVIYALGDPYVNRESKIDEHAIAKRLAPIGRVVVAQAAEEQSASTAAPAPPAPVAETTPAEPKPAPQPAVAETAQQHPQPAAPRPLPFAPAGSVPKAPAPPTPAKPAPAVEPAPVTAEQTPTQPAEPTPVAVDEFEPQPARPSAAPPAYQPPPLPRWMRHNVPLPQQQQPGRYPYKH